MDTSGSRRTIVRALREMTIVVSSILIAFGLDAWWDGQVELRELHEALRGVVSDLRETDRRLQEDIAVRQATDSALVALLSLTGPAATVPEDRDLPGLLGHAGRSYTLAPVSGSITALIRSGQIRAIQDETLRVGLAAWEENVRDLTEDEQWEGDEAFAIVRPYLVENAWVFDFGIEGAGGPFPTDYQKLLRDHRFANVMSIRLRRVRLVLQEATDLREYVQRLESLIERELPG